MLLPFAFFVGFLFGMRAAARRNGKSLDKLQYGLAYGILFTLVTLIITIIFQRIGFIT